MEHGALVNIRQGYIKFAICLLRRVPAVAKPLWRSTETRRLRHDTRPQLSSCGLTIYPELAPLTQRYQ